MEQAYKLEFDGQAVNQNELNTLGSVAGLSDDRVFAELFRMTPKGGSVARGILPYRYYSSGMATTLAPNGASGSVIVNPFRALIGSRTAVGTDALENWRDIRSAMVVATGDTTLTHAVALGANATGNSRWDAIYAAVAIDVDSSPVTRKVKSPSTSVVTEETVSLFAQTTVTLGVQPGTASSTPDWPTLPPDSGGTYYVLLGYVRVPTGFTGASTVLATDIADQAPIVKFAHGASVQIADSHHTAGSTQLTTALIRTWGSSGTRPSIYVPPCMAGSEGLIVAANITTGGTSLSSGDIVDTRDWRNRIVKWSAAVGTFSTGTNDFAWKNPSSTPIPNGLNTGQVLNSQVVVVGMGTTFPANGTIAALNGSQVGAMADSTTISLFADTVTGNLKISWTGAPNCIVMFWLEFSAPFGNAF